MTGTPGPDAGPLRVVLSLGTDHHRFDRVVAWVDRWVGEHPPTDLFAQVGTSAPATHGTSRDLVPTGELHAAMAAADVIVCHGGPGTILEARQAGVEPIVVPRDPAHGEHVDGHQQRFARWMAERDHLVTTADEEGLRHLLDQALADRGTYRRAAAGDRVAEVARRFGELVEGLLSGPGGADGS